MKKTLSIIILLAALGGIALLLQPTGDVVQTSEYSDFFREELQEEGLVRIGQPIEGFSAPMYLNGFPGLIEEDFDGVESFEGVYRFTDGELVYTRTGRLPATSAEDVISKEGYATLLDNLSERLGIPLTSTDNVEEILDTIAEPPGDQNGIMPFDSGVRGRVLVGPTCPVMMDPPDPNCADKGFATTVQVRYPDPTKSSLAASVESDEEGNYMVMLPPGDYELWPLGGNPFPACNNADVTIEPGVIQEIDLSCDTGIR